MRKVGDAARPGERRADGVVDRDAGASRLVVGQRGVDDVEQPLERGLIARRGAGGVGLGGDPRGDRAERRGAGVEALPQLGLDAAQRRLVGRSEAGPLETEAGQADDQRGREADAHDAQDEGHDQSQDTRVYDLRSISAGRIPMTRTALVLVALLMAHGARWRSRRRRSTSISSTSKGGQATLIVTPAGESLLVDTGWGGANGRDAKRIMAAAREAGHHADRLPVDHALPQRSRRRRAGAVAADSDQDVHRLRRGRPRRARRCRSRTTPTRASAGRARTSSRRSGDKLPLKGLDVQIVSGRGKTLNEPLSGAGQDNPACSAFKKKANDFTENARSFGFRLVYGKFTFLDLGDLVWNELGQLVCPKNLLGTADVYLIAHHGNAFSGVPAVTAAVHPRVVIMNNGETKGGDAKTFKTLQGLPGLEDLWQLHRSANKGAKQADEAFIANLTESTAHRIKLSANDDGSFTMTNARTGFTKHYDAK